MQLIEPIRAMDFDPLNPFLQDPQSQPSWIGQTTDFCDLTQLQSTCSAAPGPTSFLSMELPLLSTMGTLGVSALGPGFRSGTEPTLGASVLANPFKLVTDPACSSVLNAPSFLSMESPLSSTMGTPGVSALGPGFGSGTEPTLGASVLANPFKLVTHPACSTICDEGAALRTIRINSPGFCKQADILGASNLTSLTSDFLVAGLQSVVLNSPLAFEPAVKDFQHTSKSYLNFVQAAKGNAYDSTFLGIPARGYFTSGDAFLEFQRDWSISAPLQETRENTRGHIERRTETTLEILLDNVDPRLRKLWRGARMIAASTNPDKTRYASVSLRELMTQVLHTLAPDAEIRQWTSDPRQFHNGRPTRETRLRYICQPVASGALSDYILADIRSVIALGNVLQEGTHGVDADFSPLQFRLIFNRIEGALCSLIEINNASE